MIGVFIIVVTLFLVYKNKTTLTEAGALIAIASALLLSKDSLLGVDQKDNNPPKDGQ
jgi:hypothetical protein